MESKGMCQASTSSIVGVLNQQDAPRHNFATLRPPSTPTPYPCVLSPHATFFMATASLKSKDMWSTSEASY